MTTRIGSHTGGLTAAAVLLLLLVPAAPAGAQNDTCIPAASGVPFLSGPPNWWDSALQQPQYWPRPDDPRWRGSFLQAFGGGASTAHVTFRALRDANALYLSWRVGVDSLLDDEDRIWVAFSPGPGQDDILIQVIPFNTSNTNVYAPPFSVTVSTRPAAGGAWVAAGALPDWIDPATTDTRVWRDTVANSWAVHMRVPIVAGFDNGLLLSNSFESWFEVQVSHPSGMPPGWQIAPYRYPAGLSFNAVATGLNTTGWADTRRDVAPSNPSCIQGVTLVASDIGTEGGGGTCANAASTLSSQIALTDGGGNPGTNVFCARPLNETGAQIAAGDLEATFRIANWGTQPTNPAAITSVWTPINNTDVTPAVSSGAVADGAKASITTTWNLTQNEACSFTPQPPGLPCGALPANPKQRHQCMLVELSGAPGITFPVASVYRNMNFVNASRFERDAEVSVRQLSPLPGSPPQRDVYLYVQTTNMPERVRAKPPIGRGGTVPGLPGTTAPPNFDDDDVVIDGNDDEQGPIEPLDEGFYEELRRTQPTYQVHAFHETGDTVTLGGTTVQLLEPQSSFGYFVDHQGELEGWRHELVGAQQIADDFYLIAVPEDGTATVKTVIEALEPAPWSLSLHYGGNEPDGGELAGCDGDTGWGIDLENRFSRRWAGEVFAGWDDFDCPGGVIEANHFGVNLKRFLTTGTWEPFVLGGIGGYSLSSTGSDPGYSLGAGVLFHALPKLGVEATVKRHWVTTSPTTEYTTYQVGLRFGL